MSINVTLAPWYEDLVVDHAYRVSMLDDIGGAHRWVDTMCSDWNVDHVTSELDWMRFFWHFLTHEGSAPTFRQTLEVLKHAREQEDEQIYQFDERNVFLLLRQAVEEHLGQPSGVRYDEGNCAEGVYNDAVCY